MSNPEQGKVAKKQTIADLRAKKKPVVREVTLQLDGQVSLEIAALRTAHVNAVEYDKRSNEPDTALAIEEQIDALVLASKDTEYTFVFQSIGRPNYDKLVDKHKPTKEQKREGQTFNGETFPPALVAASCIDPEMTVEEASDMFADPDWNGAELARLFQSAVDANTETGDIPLSSTDSDQTLNSLLSLAMQSGMGSPTPST